MQSSLNVPVLKVKYFPSIISSFTIIDPSLDDEINQSCEEAHVICFVVIVLIPFLVVYSDKSITKSVHEVRANIKAANVKGNSKTANIGDANSKLKQIIDTV